eukprot:119444-Lingulodinium_polyedra.AAC.1
MDYARMARARNPTLAEGDSMATLPCILDAQNLARASGWQRCRTRHCSKTVFESVRGQPLIANG